MADTTVEAAAQANSHKAASRSQVWTSSTTGYQFFVDANTDLAYRKTTNSGTSFGSSVVVRTGTLSVFDIWYDKWTPGITGTTIHIAYLDSGAADVFYRSLDTSSDTLGTEITVFNGASFTAISGLWDARCVSITKARGGNLYIASNPDSRVEHGFYRSIDDGANWTTRFNMIADVSVFQLQPANTDDPQDIFMINLITAASSQPSLRLYDDSINNVWVTAAGFVAALGSTTYFQMASATRLSDGHVIFVYWNELDAATADLKCYDLEPVSASSAGIARTAKTNVLSNTVEYAQCGVCIDQNTNDIYVCYLGGGTWATDARVFYKKSTDGGGTWGAETQLDENALADQRALWCDLGGTDTRFAPCWSNIDLADLYVNVNTSVAVTPSAPAAASLIWQPRPMLALLGR